MPSYISKAGVWHPAKERVGLKNNSDKAIKNPSTDEKLKDEEVKPGEDFIYSGPDRAALYELFLEKSSTKGTDFRTDPEFLQAVRNMGYTTYKKYLKDIGYDEKKVEQEFLEKAEKINTHELPKRVKAINQLAGGRDTSGSGMDMKGDWSSPPSFEK